jgi:hypothetical protein
VILLLACAPDIRDLDHDGDIDVAFPDTGETDTDTDTDDGTTIDTAIVPSITVTDEGSGVSKVVVDANEGVTYVDLGVPEQTNVLGGWEISFERYFLRLNGGVEGPGGVEVSPITDQAFADVTTAPKSGWVTDTDDGMALEDWYIYDATEHVMYAAPVVYAVRNGAGEYWKVQFLSYYDDAGNTGFVSFYVAALPAL